MAPAGGLSAQFGMVDETTFGTPNTVTRFLEILGGENLNQTIDRIESSGLRPSRRVLGTDDWVPGHIDVAGDLPFEVQNKGFGLPLKHMLGTIASAQPNAGSFPTVWEHTAKVGALDGKSFTAQLGRADSGGTVRAFTYGGCKIAAWELDCDVDGILQLKLTVDGANESTAVALASASYATSPLVPLVFTGAALTIGGTATPVKKFSLAGDNGLKRDRWFMSATTPAQKREQLEAGLRSYTGTIDAEFMDLVLYNRFVNGTVGALTAFFTGGNIAGSFNYALEVTCPAVRFDGTTPDIAGDDIIDMSLPFKALDDGSATTAVQMVYRTTDTTP